MRSSPSTPTASTCASTTRRTARPKLHAGRGINVPDTDLVISALTDKDVDDLATVAELADFVQLSFVREPADVIRLFDELSRLGDTDLGVVLKIETREGFERLPQLMLTAMRRRRVGVMIARGDLAVECGYERMAEVQEETLWLCEAAHVPVIWATQVLEQLAKTGLPSRAEISDAAMAERAECVMLNKGPYITDAVTALDDILGRMAGHEYKKNPLLRSLDSWRAGSVPSEHPGSGVVAELVGQRVVDRLVAEAVPDRLQLGRQHPLVGLGQLACTLLTQQNAGVRSTGPAAAPAGAASWPAPWCTRCCAPGSGRRR